MYILLCTGKHTENAQDSMFQHKIWIMSVFELPYIIAVHPFWSQPKGKSVIKFRYTTRKIKYFAITPNLNCIQVASVSL